MILFFSFNVDIKSTPWHSRLVNKVLTLLLFSLFCVCGRSFLFQVSRYTIVSLLCFGLTTGLVLYRFGTYQSNKPSVVIEHESTNIVVPEQKADETVALAMEQKPTEKQSTVIIGKGDTMMSVLASIGMTRDQAHLAVDALRKVYNPKALKVGQELHIAYKPGNEAAGSTLISVDFKTSAGSDIALRYNNGEFSAEKFEVQLTKVQRKIAGKINSSFYSAALKKGVPAQIVKEAISALSYDINWQHDPQLGDEFQLMYDVFQDPEGNVIKVGELKFAAFAPGGNWRKIYAFQTATGSTGYFNDKGESVVKSLLQTPLDPTRMRVTSKFGLRHHPMLGYSKMHKGVDFGAPVGTPVMSAGDGVVAKAGWNGAYGNYVLVRHNGDYCTAYAHLSKMHVKPGTKVRQRQVIGAVGTTGRSTGPHLHYEVIFKGRHVNPQSIKQLPTTKLTGKEMAKFQEVKAVFDSYEITDSVIEVAARKLPLAG